RREMKDHLDLRDSAATHGGVAEIASQKLDRSVQPREIRYVACAEIVYDPNDVAVRDQPLSDMGADEARSPCDETSRLLRGQHAVPGLQGWRRPRVAADPTRWSATNSCSTVRYGIDAGQRSTSHRALGVASGLQGITVRSVRRRCGPRARPPSELQGATPGVGPEPPSPDKTIDHRQVAGRIERVHADHVRLPVGDC